MTMTFVKPSDREYSCLVHVDEVGKEPKTVTLSPNETECAAIAKRIGVVSVDAVTAEAVCTLESGHIIHVTGNFSATVTQECVVTLDHIQNIVSDEFEGWYSDHAHIASFKKAQHEAKTKKEFIEMPMLEEHEDPEPLENDRLDVGELFVQFLSLSIDHFAHKEGVSVEDKIPAKHKEADAKNFAPLNPFAALKNWRPKD